MLLITTSYHQLVKRQVSDLPFFACFHHFGEKFFASRHNSLRVVFVHIYPTRSFFLGRRKHELAVFVLGEFDHDGPGFRSGAARSVCPLDRHGAYLSFRKFQRCCHFSAHVFSACSEVLFSASGMPSNCSSSVVCRTINAHHLVQYSCLVKDSSYVADSK